MTQMVAKKGRDVRKVVDVPGVDPQPAWDEEVPVQRYILYTAEELAAQAEAKKKGRRSRCRRSEEKRQSWKPCRGAWTLWKRQTTTLCL